MNAAALMTADQYRLRAMQTLEQADDLDPYQVTLRRQLAEYAKVYALLAISAQAAENREDVPF